jgi:hypothetical protein
MMYFSVCIFRQCTFLWYFLTDALCYDADDAMWTCESLFLGLDRHHKAYELSVDLQFCEFKAVETGKVLLIVRQ